ncbi:hypothetical protein [uncultured Pseudoalteromonas sp.]|uniref:hypothetical protein n=1 Tax=uncultured Pseudoalteromonas sp. TaxID=114053 RepID=UPI0025EEA00C|nr:hypothetical protein [uncultured Pseudoalteromonas sp.]|tara:strand:+ start:4810 stop:5115 length:306 start_codon:yes stop_codon:yes gene_type:complete
MLITIILVSVWALLMLYAASAEYKYYQSVKTLEPELWQQLGAPRFLKVPMVFVSKKGLTLLNSTENETVRANAKKHRQAGILFLSYVGLVLVSAIVFFKLA